MENYLEIFLWKKKPVGRSLENQNARVNVQRTAWIFYELSCRRPFQNSTRSFQTGKKSETLRNSHPQHMNICQGQHETLRNFHPQENESDFFSNGSMKHS